MINGPMDGQQGEQFSQPRTEIKNVLPFDLYEGMMRASFLVTEIYQSSTSPSVRKTEDFVHIFWTVFNFTKLKINPTLKKQIEDWFNNMKIPVPNRPGLPRNSFLVVGINLYMDFYDELVRLGIGSMFDEPIMPPIALTAELEDESIWENAPE